MLGAVDIGVRQDTRIRPERAVLGLCILLLFGRDLSRTATLFFSSRPTPCWENRLDKPIMRKKPRGKKPLEDEEITRILMKQYRHHKVWTKEEQRVIRRYERSGRAKYLRVTTTPFFLQRDEHDFLLNLLSRHAPSKSDVTKRVLHDKLIQRLREPKDWFTAKMLLPPRVENVQTLQKKHIRAHL